MLPLVGNLLLFCILAPAIKIAAMRRKTRWPFKPTDKLLRAPGESLQRSIAKIDEQISESLFIGVLLCTGFCFLTYLPPSPVHWLNGTPLAIALSIITAVALSFRLNRLIKRRANHHVGWFGERTTAEFLESLKGSGYRVFHDLQCQGSQTSFNIDHIVVGPTGVFVIETKTRRKRKGTGQAAIVESEVSFDGTSLIFPWGADVRPVKQAMDEAKWLYNELKTQLGITTYVRPIISLPSWYVKETPCKEIRVVNPSYIAKTITSVSGQPLDTANIERISDHLERLSRNIED